MLGVYEKQLGAKSKTLRSNHVLHMLKTRFMSVVIIIRKAPYGRVTLSNGVAHL